MEEAWQQFTEGAITYVEFVRRAIAEMTEDDVRSHNEVCGKEQWAEFPFIG